MVQFTRLDYLRLKFTPSEFCRRPLYVYLLLAQGKIHGLDLDFLTKVYQTLQVQVKFFLNLEFFTLGMGILEWLSQGNGSLILGSVDTVTEPDLYRSSQVCSIKEGESCTEPAGRFLL